MSGDALREEIRKRLREGGPHIGHGCGECEERAVSVCAAMIAEERAKWGHVAFCRCHHPRRDHRCAPQAKEKA